MRILILASEFPPGPGGIGTHAFEVAKGLAQTGDDVLVLAPQDYAAEESLSRFNAGLPFSLRRLAHGRISVLEGLSHGVILCRTLRAWQPEVVMTSGMRPSWLMAACSLVFRQRWAAVGHGTEFGGANPWHRRLTVWAFKRADACIAVSEFTRTVIANLGVPPGSIFVIPNGANPEGVQEALTERVERFREAHGLKDGQVVLLSVGHLSERKGQDIVIRALPRIVAAGYDAHYLLVGLPGRKDQLVALAAQLGISGRVHFLGAVARDELLSAYAACDIFMMTSRMTADGDFEGYGIAVIEAALHAKPAVVTRCGGLPEAVIDHVTGRVVNENDPEDAAHAVVELLEQPGLANKLGFQARQRAEQECLWSQRVLQYRQILSGVAQE